ncbi:MAG: hypothetical protein ABJA81_04610 [Nocardioidaceae bacterium]
MSRLADAAGPRLSLPGPQERWRCAGCGNLTRFDVVRDAQTREFWHVDLSGEPSVEETETLEQIVRSVTCRWCGRDDTIEVVPRPGESPR